MKLIINPINLEDLKTGEILLVGVHPFSHSINHIFSDADALLKFIDKHPNQLIFVMLNHLIQNTDLPVLNQILQKLDHQVAGLLFEDYSVLHLVVENNYQINLYLAQKNSITSAKLINISEAKIKGALISNDLSITDLNEVINHNQKQTIIHAYGYQNIYYSRRPVITNYLETFNIPKLDNYQIKRDNMSYPIIEDNNFSYIYTDKIFNIINALAELATDKIAYCLINSYLVENERFKRDLQTFREYSVNNRHHQITLEKEFYSTYQLYNPNYYKVKDHE